MRVPCRDLDRLGAEAHRAAEVLDLLLLREQVDHRVRRLGVHLRRVRAVEPDHVARELRDGDVHAEADAEVRDRVLAGDPAGEDLPLPAARAEPAGNQDPVHCLELMERLLERHALGVDPADPHMAAVVDPRVLERLVHREVGVVELHVLADERDLDSALALPDPLGQLVPLAQVGLALGQAELLADEIVEALLLEQRRYEVHVGDVLVRDHLARLDVGEQRDLVAHVRRDRVARAADDDVRVDTDAAQLVDRVLRRLRLQLACRVDEAARA